MIDISEFKEYFTYVPETGHFLWAKKPNGKGSAKVVIGSRAGWVSWAHGYRELSFKRLHLLEHRCAWLYMTGEWPEKQVEHKDINRANNAWSNLRLATQTNNNANHPKRSDNTSGFKGVGTTKAGRSFAQIRFKGQHYYLGAYDTAEEAARVYDAKLIEFHGEFARTNFGENRA